MPVARTLTLERRGRVKVRVNGTNHCGAPSAVVDGQVTVEYTVRLTVGANDLDERGFLVDQESLHALLTELGHSPAGWQLSCEQLTLSWANTVLHWVSVANIGCTVHAFELTLSPAPHLGSFTVRHTA